MVICPDCGKDVPDAKFCKNCGARLPEVEEISKPVEVEEKLNAAEDTILIEAHEVIDERADNDSNTESRNSVKFCSNCGYEIDGEFRFCPNCGFNLTNPVYETNKPSYVSGEKNIIVAIVLSVIFPGLGQFYLGLNNKGAIFLIAYIISAILILLFIGFVLCFIIWIWALVDAIQSTNALNRGEEVEDKLLG